MDFHGKKWETIYYFSFLKISYLTITDNQIINTIENIPVRLNYWLWTYQYIIITVYFITLVWTVLFNADLVKVLQKVGFLNIGYFKKMN